MEMEKGIKLDVFDKRQTSITKGLLVIFLLIHHVLFPNNIENYQIITIMQNQIQCVSFVMFCKVCVGGFVFLSAFGMTRSFKQCRDNELFFRTLARWIKLESTVLLIYVLAVLFEKIIMKQSLCAVYMPDDALDGNFFKLVIFMMIDALGFAQYMGTPTINVTWWYLSLAVLEIVVMPLVYLLYRRVGKILIFPLILIAPIIWSGGVFFSSLIPCIILGTAFSYENWFEHLGKYQGVKNKCMKLAIMIAFLLLEYCVYLMFGWHHIFYALTFIFPWISFEIISRMPIVNKLLEFVGKYSISIFLTHTFIYYYWYTELLYSLRYSYLIILVLLAICLLIAIGIDVIKKYTGYEKLVQVLINRIGENI